MKQLIVLIATIILGVAIGGIIIGFSGTAKTITTDAGNAVSGIVSVYSNAAVR